MSDAAMVLIDTHDIRLVVLSVMIAAIASYPALDLAGRVTVAQGLARRLWLAGGAIAMGVGIWSMHFIAMLAYHLPIPGLSGVSVVSNSMATVFVSEIALFVVSCQRVSGLQLLGGSVFMGASIAAMHYRGIAAMQPEAIAQYSPRLVAPSMVLLRINCCLRLRRRNNYQQSMAVLCWNF